MHLKYSLQQLWLKKTNLFYSEHRLKTKIDTGRRILVVFPANTELDERREWIMSEDEQERISGAAEDDFNRQSQIYTATEDTLFTKTTSTLSRTHSLVSMSH